MQHNFTAGTIRFRGEKNILEIAKNLDAFRKVPAEYVENGTLSGGLISLLSRLLIIFLIYNEIKYYQESNLVYTFKPNIDLDAKVRMNVDITIAMPCIRLSGVDLIDETKQDVFSAPSILKRESTWWDLDSDQRKLFEEIRHVNAFLREEYHSVADYMIKDMLRNTEQSNLYQEMPERTTKPNKPHDACRIHGTFLINKVAGILHFVSGSDSISIGFVDNQLQFFRDFQTYPLNFTHRINKLSFGNYGGRIVQPLEGDEKLVPEEKSVMQYFIEIVPTEIHGTFSKIDTFQYSVKENIRNINSQKNSYGVPGIYFKYDWSALKVIVKPDRDNIIQLIIRLSSIIAGIVVISGIINSVLQYIHDNIMHLFAPQIFTKKKYIGLTTPETFKNTIPGASNLLLKNNLLIDDEDESLPILVH